LITIQDVSTENYAVFMESREIWEKVIGKDRLCEGKFYELLNRPGCPKISCGRKYLIPVKKFIEWLENQAVSA
jgi:hypothetical protein